MMRLSPGDWYEIKGRGWVATFPGVTGFDPRSLAGQRVEIDGRAYTVRGVETFPTADATGQAFGLLVSGR